MRVKGVRFRPWGLGISVWGLKVLSVFASRVLRGFKGIFGKRSKCKILNSGFRVEGYLGSPSPKP